MSQLLRQLTNGKSTGQCFSLLSGTLAAFEGFGLKAFGVCVKDKKISNNDVTGFPWKVWWNSAFDPVGNLKCTKLPVKRHATVDFGSNPSPR